MFESKTKHRMESSCDKYRKGPKKKYVFVLIQTERIDNKHSKQSHCIEDSLYYLDS